MKALQTAQLIVWYDGNCPLCLREIDLMRKLDKRKAIKFNNILSTDNTCPIDPGELLARFHVEENGKLLSGAEAFAAMWRAIPILRPFGLAAKNQFVLKCFEALYKIFLTHRPKLQRCVTWLERK